MKRFLLFFILIGIIIGIFIGISNHSKNENLDEEVNEENYDVNYIDELTMSFIQADNYNPIKNTQVHNSYILQLIYEPLFMFDAYNQIEGILAKEWMQKNENTWIVRLRDNVYWHNGEKFTATDAIYTINTIKDSSNESIYLSNLKNVLEVKYIDDENFEIILEESDPYFISKLIFPIVPKSHFENIGLNNKEISKNLIGTGPYKCIAEYDESIVLTSNEYWWKNDNIRLKTINLKKYASYSEAIKGFKSTDIDIILTNMYNWKEAFGFIGINSYKFESTEYDVLIPNSNIEIFEDNSVKKMLLYGINRDNIVNDVYGGNAIISDIPIMSNSKFAETNAEYDIEISKQILLNGGWKNEDNKWKRNGKTLKFTLLVSNEEKDKIEVAEKIKLDMKELDIDIIVKPVKKEELLNSIKKDNFELILTTFDIKNENTIMEIISKDNEKNFANYSNEKIENKIERLKGLAGNEFENEFKTICSMYKNEVPYVGLYFKTNNILANKAVKGEYKSTAYAPFRNIINFSK